MSGGRYQTEQAGTTPWAMLAIVCAGFVALTLNWFDVAAAFPLIRSEFRVGLGSLSYLISVFIVGYGLAHIPSGMLATKVGMKRTLVAGLLLQGAAGIMSGLSYSYTELAWFRVISAIGGSLFVTVAFAACAAWFRDRELALALGICGGAAFSAGAAFALYIWVYLQRATSWHTALVLGGIVELLVAAATAAWFRIPPHVPALAGARFDRAALVAAVSSRDLWFYGIAFLGGYGAYFTTAQLFSDYATSERGLDHSTGSLLAAMVALAGVPGSLVGGWWSDRWHNLRALIVASLVAVGGLLLLIPVLATGWLWVLGIGIGFLVIFAFSAWSTVPARVSGISHEYVGTAVGLMLTLVGIGGFFVPIAFGHIVPDLSYGAGWRFLAIVTIAFALVGLLGRNPRHPNAARAEPPQPGRRQVLRPVRAPAHDSSRAVLPRSE